MWAYPKRGARLKLSYQNMSVLLVDNYTMSIDTLTTYLEPFKFYRVWTAKNGDEALQVLAEREVNLLITAWKMKPMSGLQLLERVRKTPAFQKLPVLLMMDNADKTLRAMAAKAGATGLLKLPLDPKTLVKATEAVLEEFIDPAEEEFLVNLDKARKAKRRNRTKEAIAAYRAALAAKHDQQTALSLATLLQEAGQTQEAEQLYMEMIRTDPTMLKPYIGLAGIYEQTDRLTHALKVLATAMRVATQRKDSGDTRASLYFYMGEIELKLQHLKEALGMFQKATEAAPDDLELQVKIGDKLAANGNLSESEHFYRMALERNPALAHVYNRLGIACRKQGKIEAALALYQKALSFHPDDENLIYNMARCHYETGAYQQVVDVIRRALQINPEFTEAQHLMDVCLHRLGFQVTADGKEPDNSKKPKTHSDTELDVEGNEAQ